MRRILQKIKSAIAILRNVNKVAEMVADLQQHKARLESQVKLQEQAISHMRASGLAAEKAARVVNYKRVDSDDEANTADDVIAMLKADLAQAHKNYDKLADKHKDVVNRNQALEEDARRIAVNQLLIKAHEIAPDTRMLILTTKNMSIVNHATYANLTNRLQRICTHLDAIVLLADDTKVEKLNRDQAAKDHNIVGIPWRQDWNERRADILEDVIRLFDLYARDKEAYNGPDLYR